jgi:capsular exopolysaccharide synthesis family protein
MDPAVPVSQPASAPAAPDGASLVQLLLILRRRWRLLTLVWGATVATVGVYTFTTSRLYRPQATLEIQPPTPVVSTSEVNDPGFMAGRLMWENYYRTQEQILRSPSLIKSMLETLPDVHREYMTRPDPIKAVLDNLDIEKVRNSFVMKVGFIDADPDKATRVVNVLVQRYLEDANRRLRELKAGAVEVLSRETLPAIRQKVDAADQSLRDFQQEAGYLDFEEHYKSLVRARNAFDSRITEIRLKRARVRAELDALSSYGSDGVKGLFNPAFHSTRTLEPLGAERTRVAAELAKERKLLKPRHPRILELEEQLLGVELKVREAIEGTLEALHRDLKSVEFEEKGLIEEQALVDREIGKAGSNLTRHRRLESELASAKDLYNAYLKKHGETSATSGAGLASVRVVDNATLPLVPYKPKVMTNLLLSMVVGVVLGLGAIFVTEQLDDRIVSAREIEAFIGLDVLAVVPKLSSAKRPTELPVLLDDDSHLPEFEAFRSLRAELVTRLEGVNGPKVVSVLSALQGEGKSTVTVNLGKVLAMEGRRVLIVDSDMRRPTILSTLGACTGPSLEQVLRGEATLENAVQSSQVLGVHILGAVTGTMNAAELLGSPRFQDVIAWALSKYDVTLIDSPPINQVSESALIARQAHVALLVIRHNQTGRGAAQAAKKRLVGMSVNIVGSVLNFASPHREAYGYGYSYGYPASSSTGVR